MSNNARKLRWWKRLMNRFRKEPVRMGPCKYCKEPAEIEILLGNEFCAHTDCINKAWEQRKAEEAEAAQMKLLKRAVKEVLDESSDRKTLDDIWRALAEKGTTHKD